MSLMARRIYVNTERELEIEKSRSNFGDGPPGAPATPTKSLLIEFACEADSTLSATMFECGGDAIRVHKDSFDIFKDRDVRRLIEIVRQNSKCNLWSSIPCGPWSTWQYVNLSQYGLNSLPSSTTLEDSPRSCSRPSFEFLAKYERVAVELPMSGRVIALGGLNPS